MQFYHFQFLSLHSGSVLNPIALRKAKIYTILAFLNAVGLKETICSSLEWILPFKKLHHGTAALSRDAKRISWKLFLFVKETERHGSVPTQCKYDRYLPNVNIVSILIVIYALFWYFIAQSTCPTSIQNFFKSNNIVCNRANITKKLHYFKELEVPQVCFSDPENKTEEHCGYLDMYEWLGACAVGADM